MGRRASTNGGDFAASLEDEGERVIIRRPRQRMHKAEQREGLTETAIFAVETNERVPVVDAGVGGREATEKSYGGG